MDIRWVKCGATVGTLTLSSPNCRLRSKTWKCDILGLTPRWCTCLLSPSSHHRHALAVSIKGDLGEYMSLLANSGAAQVVVKRPLIILATDTAKSLVSDPCLEKVHQSIGFTTPMILKAGIAPSIFCSGQGYTLPVLTLIEDDPESMLTTIAKKCPSVYTIECSVMQPSVGGMEMIALIRF